MTLKEKFLAANEEVTKLQDKGLQFELDSYKVTKEYKRAIYVSIRYYRMLDKQGINPFN